MENIELAEPRYVDGPAMYVAGLSDEYTKEQTAEIPKQWERFIPELFGKLRADAYGVTWGVVYASTPMRYVTGVEIECGVALPEGWVRVEIPEQKYAVFAGSGGVPMIQRMWGAIWSDWLPKSGRKLAEGPMLERYPPNWVESRTFEIWVPVEG